MKKLFFSALAALALAGPSQGAKLYSTNLGNGITELGGLSAITTGTVRFGVFPSGFDFAANSENFAAMDAAFTEVCSYTGPVSVNSVTGFFDLALTYDAAATFEGVPYDSSAGATTAASGDIAGEKVYVWLLNSATPATATQQAVFSTSQRWADADDLVTDTFVTPDTGSLELAAHLGTLASGNNIGAGAPSHSAAGALVVPAGVEVTVNPATAQVLAGTRVVFTVTNTSGTPPISRQWRRNGIDIPGQTGTTYTIASASLNSRATYDCVLSNGTNVDVPSNGVFLNVVTPRPSVITPPQSTIVGTGAAANFGITAVGAGTLKYSWKKGSAILSSAPTLTVPSAALTDGGAYSVSVTNTPGAGTGSVSATVNLVVVNQNATTVLGQIGKTATLQVLTSGTGITRYEWFLASDLLNPIENGVKYAGATTAKLTIKSLALADTDAYVCRVTAHGSSVVSGNINLVVYNAAPTLGAIPSLPTGIVGGFYSFQIPQATLPDGSNIAESFTAAPLPAGLKLDAKTGIISGYPTAPTTATTKAVRITAVNKVNKSAFVDVPIVINAFPAGVAGTYEGPVHPDNVLGGDLGGRIDITISGLGAVTGKVTLGTVVLPVTGRLSIVGTDPATAVCSAEIPVKRTSGAPLNLEFLVSQNLLVGESDSNPATEDLGSISLGDDSLTFEAWRKIWNARPTTDAATAYAARYNAAIRLTDESPQFGDAAAAPQGSGFFTFTVAADGKLNIDGTLPDGTKFAGPAFIGPSGQLFIFRTLYTTAQKGSIIARFDISRGTVLDQAADNTLTGDARWTRPQNTAASNKLYRSGFVLDELEVVGGAYALSSNASGLALNVAANGTASLNFTGAGIAAAANNPNATVRILTAAKHEISARTSTAAKTTLTLTQATGAFKGGFEAQVRKVSSFNGLIVPIEGTHTGVGYFLLDQAGTPVTQQSGTVSFEKINID